MITISISAEAYEAIKATLPKNAQTWPAQPNGRGRFRITLPKNDLGPDRFFCFWHEVSATAALGLEFRPFRGSFFRASARRWGSLRRSSGLRL